MLPRHLRHYDGLCDTLKLAGRVTRRDPVRYLAVLDAYVGRRDILPRDIGGGPASVLEPVDVPDDLYETILGCDKDCVACTICRDYYDQAVRHSDEAYPSLAERGRGGWNLAKTARRYQWLLFDADGTLFDYDRAEASALAGAFRQFDAPFGPGTLAAYRRINQQLWRAWELGQITPEALAVRRFERLFEEVQLSISPQVFSTAYTEHLATCSELNDGALQVLQVLHGRYRLAILTNGLQMVQRPRLARSAIRDYIAEMIVSEEVGVAKPDAAFFDAAFARLGYPPRSAVLMIGDSLTADIQGATNYGLDTCWYNPARQARPDGLAITYEIAHLGELIPALGFARDIFPSRIARMDK